MIFQNNSNTEIKAIALALLNASRTIPVDGKTHAISIGGQYGDESYIVGKATKDSSNNYYSLPFKCIFFTKYSGSSGIVWYV